MLQNYKSKETIKADKVMPIFGNTPATKRRPLLLESIISGEKYYDKGKGGKLNFYMMFFQGPPKGDYIYLVQLSSGEFIYRDKEEFEGKYEAIAGLDTPTTPDIKGPKRSAEKSL